MTPVVVSELIRLLRIRVLATWFGLMVFCATLLNFAMFNTNMSASVPSGGGPGVTFPDLRTLESSEGLTAGLSAAANMFGVVTLSFWAIAVATDYSTGVIRILVSARPQRWVLLLGKIVALLGMTILATAVATVANITVAPMAAQMAGLRPESWLDDPVLTVTQAFLDLLAANFVWGMIGLTLAVLLRSSAAAIAIGIGYVLVVEGVIRMAFETPPRWLLGTTLGSLASGGSTSVSHPAALTAGLAYALLGWALATVVLMRRDIKD